MAASQRQQSNIHHYVPQWYQRDFLQGASKLWRLDLAPGFVALPSGCKKPKKALKEVSPSSCFQELHLYTTRYGQTVSDAVESQLFNLLDNQGAEIVRAFASADNKQMAAKTDQLFEYMNAQKMRTPKGLGWISSKYPKLDQNELMEEMQHLRTMHCTIWCECVREIVSAEDSQVKFIISDHPVTQFNNGYEPTSNVYAFPEDPSIAKIGTHTIFPLSPNHCLILTNLEYALDQDRQDLRRTRTYARRYRDTFFNNASPIRIRKFNSEKVSLINALIKLRAHKYIAARKKEWLCPECSKADDYLSQVSDLLKPPREKSKQFYSNIVAGNNQGETWTYDAFGRSSNLLPFLKAPSNPPEDLNSACICGSGRSYKTCCRLLPEEHRVASNIVGIRERNLMLIAYIKTLLKQSDKEQLAASKRMPTAAQVKCIHRKYMELWPEGTVIEDLLPRPTTIYSRALYFGPLTELHVLRHVLSMLQVFDEIVLFSPILNAVKMNILVNPIVTPEKYIARTREIIYILMHLEHYITKGRIHIVPDSMDYDTYYSNAVFDSAEKRLNQEKFTEDDIDLLDIYSEDHFNIFANSDPHVVKALLQRHNSSTSSFQVERFRNNLKQMRRMDPIGLFGIYNEKNTLGSQPVVRSPILEAALYFAHLTGSCIYTHDAIRWRMLGKCMRSDINIPQWDTIRSAISSYRHYHCYDPACIHRMSNHEYRLAFRRSLWLLREYMLETEAHPSFVLNAKAMANKIQEALTSPIRFNEGMRNCFQNNITEPPSRFLLSAPYLRMHLNTVSRLLAVSDADLQLKRLPFAIFVGDVKMMSRVSKF